MKGIKIFLISVVLMVGVLVASSALVEREPEVIYIGGEKSIDADVAAFETGNVEVCFYDASEGTTDCQQTHNAATSDFANHTMRCLSGTNTSEMNCIVNSIMLSTGITIPAVTDTSCEVTQVTGNGLDAVNATTITEIGSPTGGNYTMYHTFTATGTQAGISKVCVSNHTSFEWLFASALLSSTVNMENNDQLTINYSIAIIP